MLAAHAEGRFPRGTSVGLYFGCGSQGWRRDPLVLTTADSLRQYCEIVGDAQLCRPVLDARMSTGPADAASARPRVTCRDQVEAMAITAQRVG